MSTFKKIKEMLNPTPYFLVLGVGRGGTSLLAAMLDSNPDLTVGMEQFVFDYLLARKIDEKSKLSLDVRIHGFHEACKAMASSSKTIWGNKITTEQVSNLAHCADAVWPNYISSFIDTTVGKGKIVYIVRDGRSCVNSKLKRTKQDYPDSLKKWKYSVLLLNYLKENHENLHLVKYEDLLENPEKELKTISKFLDIPFSKNMLEGHKNSILPDMYKGQALKPVEKQEWPDEWTEDMRTELTELGYL